ncbi:MAG: hypothetical protein OHK0046_10480 [Anaerolineae bacterium]
MSPITLRHYDIVIYLTILLRMYLQLRPLGRILGDPFVQRLDALKSRRQGILAD